MAVILVVDDDFLILDMTSALVEDAGHTVLSANNSAAAIAILRAQNPIDALLTDVRLHDNLCGGYDLARAAIAIRPGLSICYMSGTPMMDHVKAEIVDDAHFLQKPFGLAELQRALDGMLAAPA